MLELLFTRTRTRVHCNPYYDRYRTAITRTAATQTSTATSRTRTVTMRAPKPPQHSTPRENTRNGSQRRHKQTLLHDTRWHQMLRQPKIKGTRLARSPAPATKGPPRSTTHTSAATTRTHLSLASYSLIRLILLVALPTVTCHVPFFP